MAKIPTHIAGDLASARTGVPGPDTSGIELGQSIAKFGADIHGVLSKQQELLSQAELSKSISEYDAKQYVTAAEIRQRNVTNPEQAIKELQAYQAEALNEFKGKITDPDAKLRFDAVAFDSNQKELAKTKIWAVGENSKLIQQKYIDTINQNAHALNEIPDIEQLFEKSHLTGEQDEKKLALRDNIYRAWGGVTEGEKVIRSSNEANFKAFFLGQLSRGNGFAALEQLKDPRIAKLNLDPQKVRQMEAWAMKVADADKSNRAALTLAEIVKDNGALYDGVMKGDISLTEITEKSNALSFQIANTMADVQEGKATPEELQTLQGQQRILELLQEARMTRDRGRVVPDPDVSSQMQAQFNSLFALNKKKRPSIVGGLDEVFRFQQDLLANRNQIEPREFDRMMRFAEVAFQDEIQGVIKNSKLSVNKSFLGFGPQTDVKDTKALSGDPKLRTVMADVVGKTTPKYGQEFAYETLRFFMDDLEEKGDLKDPMVLGSLSKTALQEMMRGAQAKAQLKKLGLPVHLKVKDAVVINGASFDITSFDEDGMPVVSIGQ